MISIPSCHAAIGSSPLPPSSGAGTEREPAKNVIEEIGVGDEMFTGDKVHYFGVGKSALQCIEAALFAANRLPSSVANILDLPCGHGRVLRSLKAAFPQARITACDLNRGGVEFCARSFDPLPVYSNVDISQIPIQGSFDLIWSGSLLTHLPAEQCAAFIRLFNSLITPGGLIVFTLHGRWVERSLVTGRSKYGLNDAAIFGLLAQYYKTGFGYANYPGSSGYGVSVAAPAFVLSQLVRLADLKLITYHERGWDNHQDVVCIQKLAPGSLLG
jgi:SAM-dependent methyltransferase